jgi:hypothetical protein
MSRRRRVDRGKIVETVIEGEAGQMAGEAARDLGNIARHFAIEILGPLLTPDRRATVVELGARGHPIELVIRLSPPRSIAFLAADIELARIDFDTVQ